MTSNNQNNFIRIAKRIAASGYCSRREAEKFIKSKKVQVNHKIVDNLGLKIQKYDKIIVNGILLNNIPATKLFMFNKPKGYIVSKKDPQKRKTIYNILPEKMQKLLYIGRLDFNTEGLLLLTNNGNLKRYFELPKNNIERKYKVKVYGNIRNIDIEKLKKGISIEGINYKNIILNVIYTKEKISWIEMKLKEGKNREIRKILSFFNLKVNDLIRTNFGSYSLNNLKKGDTKELKLSSNILKKVDFD